MAQQKGTDYENIGGRIPKKLADDLNEYVAKIGRDKTYVINLALEHYLNSPVSQIEILKRQIWQLEWDKKRLRGES